MKLEVEGKCIDTLIGEGHQNMPSFNTHECNGETEGLLWSFPSPLRQMLKGLIWQAISFWRQHVINHMKQTRETMGRTDEGRFIK